MSVFPKGKESNNSNFESYKNVKNGMIADLNDLTLRRIMTVKDNDTRGEKIPRCSLSVKSEGCF